jgi:colanic acid/amylovoran biosynthesis glycosyltransferase
VRLAYLCNVYPAVSHSFVRREIEAVERMGHVVQRFSLRPPPDNLRDEADLREQGQTEIVLDGGLFRLLLASLVLCLSRPAKSVSAMSAAWRLSSPGFRSRTRHIAYWLEAAWLVRRFDQLRIEHLHAHFGTNPAAVGAIVTAWGGPPFSFTAHGPDEFDAPVQLSLEEKIRASSFVAAISSYGRSQLMRWSMPGQWPKIGVVRCGLSHDFLGLPTEPVPSASTHFVCVARLSAQKGLPLLISACDRLRSNGERFSLSIIGDGEMREEIEAEITRRNLGAIVQLAGIRTASEIRDYLKESRAFVLPSFAEGLPVVIMEALALSRPVISTAVAGIPELVDQTCGWLIPAGSEEALVEAMRAALRASPEELTRMGAVGKERVQRMHDADTNAAELVAAITSARPTGTR